MHRLLLLASVLCLCFGLTAGGVQARPAPAWLTTRTAAQHDLAGRFANVARVACDPDRSSATRLTGSNRRWQRFWCSGSTFDGAAFRVKFRTTGPCAACWTVSNLTGVAAAHLRTRTAPQPRRRAPAPAVCPASSYRNVSGHCVPRPSSSAHLRAGGPTAECVDGTYSYSEHASGTCSGHGGVARWISHP